MKLQVTGLSIVGAMLAAAGVIITVFLIDMSDNTLMGSSPKFKPAIPMAKPVDITNAPQCAHGYDKTWVGCQRLAE